MRVLVAATLGLTLTVAAANQPKVQEEPKAQKVTFQHDVQPILESRCMPCHFSGGKMYATLPFDKPQTIVTLGEKLFTRIRDPKSHAVIRQFLAAEGRARPASDRRR